LVLKYLMMLKTQGESADGYKIKRMLQLPTPITLRVCISYTSTIGFTSVFVAFRLGLRVAHLLWGSSSKFPIFAPLIYNALQPALAEKRAQAVEGASLESSHEKQKSCTRRWKAHEET